jgi:hypothetical protein
LVWDADGSAPDPFIQVFVDGVSVGTTSARANTRFPTWTARFRGTVSNGSIVELDVWDEDIAAHDFAFTCALTIGESMLRARTFTCTAASGQIVRGAFTRYP